MPHLVRFSHADFLGKEPGVPIVPSTAVLTAGFQQGLRDALVGPSGYQFVVLSELTGKPCVPVFSVSNAGTGLNVKSLASANTDTPVWTLNLARVG